MRFDVYLTCGNQSFWLIHILNELIKHEHEFKNNQKQLV